MADFHFTLAQDVQEGTTGLRLEDMAPAQRTAVEQRGLHPEALQQEERRSGGEVSVGVLMDEWTTCVANFA